ncbi:MAG: response regulator [Candidatus Omnitrophica bacterium]|nr:response regulator [Candidatus Omnitrophota bacterium]
MARERIVIADDEADIRDVLRITLEHEGFEVEEAANGADALALIRRRSPHVVILDSKMPEMTGEEVCRTLKKDILLRHLPVLLVTAKGETADKVKGLGAGADDYIVKPFEPAELVARVRMVLRRTTQALDANPLTKLPGNSSIMEELERRLQQGGPMAAGYVDLDQFKAFNDAYGFERGDEVIRETARILLTTLQRHGTPDDFLGHIGGDDFVFVTTPAAVDAVAAAIVRETKASLAAFYDAPTRRRGYLEGKDRGGRPMRVGLLSCSVAVVTNERRALTHVAEIAQIGAELKSWAKSRGGSQVVKDRRTEA